MSPHDMGDQTVVTDMLQPVNTDGLAIKYNGNAATIEAKFKQIDEWSARTGTVREWITDRAVRCGKGILAIDSAQSLPFIKSEYIDESPPTAARPAKPSAERYAEYEAYATRTHGMTAPAGPTTAISGADQRIYVVAPHETRSTTIE